MTAKKTLGTLILGCLICFSAVGPAHGQGPSVTGVGPVNRSMGGAGTAAPLDAIGALHWNPASISGLSQSEMAFGIEFINIGVDLTTSIGGGAPNTTSGDAGFTPIPSVGWVHHVDDTPITVGLGVMGVAGFKNNLPVDAGSPFLAAGPAYADAEVLQIIPTISYALSDRLSIGVAPTISLGTITLDPIGASIFTPLPTAGSGNRVHWGGGFQVGAYFVANEAWRFGFAYKSRQWFETFHFHTPSGTFLTDFDYPMILTAGTAYTGMEKWTIAADARYFDYGSADGFDRLGFSSVFAFAIGAQYEASENLRLRAGYNINANPISEGDVFANVITPLIQEQNVAVGGSLRLACNVDFNAAYVYLVETSETGPLPTTLFPANSTIKNEINAHSAIFGVTVRY